MLSLTYTALWLSLMVLLWQKGGKLDQWAKKNCLKIKTRRELPSESELLWLQSLITGLRGGQSLDEILEAQRPGNPRVAKILARVPSDDLASKILVHSLQYGTRCLDVLQQLRAQQASELRAQRRAQSLLAQAQVQAWIIACLPWILLITLMWMDANLGKIVWHSPLSWLAWSLAAALDLGAIKWLMRLSRRALNPSDQRQRILELELLPFIRYMQALLSAGKDIEDSARESVQACAPSLKPFFFSLSEQKILASPLVPPEVFTIRRLLNQSLSHGTPLRAELSLMLDEIESQRDSRCERALQVLPVKALMPLFSCAFPATLLILASFLSPLLSVL